MRSTSRPGAQRRFLSLLTLALLLCCGSDPADPAGLQAGAAESGAKVSGLYDVGGGRKMYLERKGTGTPIVILEAGFRNNSTIWQNENDPANPLPLVFDEIAKFTTVVAYDRPGTVLDGQTLSKSDPVPMPRTPEEIATDLHALLQAADIQGPYVFVSHSLGGLFTRVYIGKYPEDAVGLVLIDAWPEGLPELLGDEYPLFQKLVLAVPPPLSTYADLEVVDPAKASQAMLASQASSPLKPMPFRVLSRGIPLDLGPDLPAGFPDRVEQAWQAGQAQLAALLPGTTRTIAQHSSHYIQLFEPQLVIDATRDIVDQLRRQ